MTDHSNTMIIPYCQYR